MNNIAAYFTNQIMLISIIIGSVIMTAWWLKFQKKLSIRWYVAPILAISHFVLGAVALKIWGTLEAVLGFDENATMKLFGGLFLLPPLYYLGAKLTKRDTKLVMDISSVCLGIGFIGRVSCLVNGCCQGAISVAGKVIRMPLNEIELLFCSVFVLYHWQRIYKRKTNGLAFPIFAIAYGTLRFVLEWFRVEYTTVGFFHLAHIWSLIAIAVGAVMYHINRKKHHPGRKGRTKNKPDTLVKGG